MEAELAETQIVVTRSTRRRARAISTTIGVVLAGYILKFGADLFVSILVPIFSSYDVTSEFGSGFLTFINILWSVLPAMMGGMYWLALRGLQRRRMRVVMLMVTGFGVAFFLGTGFLFTVIDFATVRFIYGNVFYSPHLFFIILQVLVQPFALFIVLLLSLAFAGVIVNIARFFTVWPPLDTPADAKRDWRDFGATWGVATIIAAASFIGFIFMERYLQTLLIDQTISLTMYPVLLRVIEFFIPIGIVAAIACAHTLHALRDKPLPEIVPTHDDPFASSDGSFTLSISPINERE